jgi:hypothetical protein
VKFLVDKSSPVCKIKASYGASYANHDLDSHDKVLTLRKIFQKKYLPLLQFSDR